MKRKINFRFFLLTAVSILVTLVLATAVFYELFKEEILSDLETYAYVLKSTGVFDEEKDYKDYHLDTDQLRITLVEAGGQVVYDNQADVADMDNHNNRPEVAEAFEDGEGMAVRHSATIDKNTFYYAIRLNDGCVLRLAKESGSIWSVFLTAFPQIIFLAMILLFIEMILSHYLTRSLVEPIERMANDMEHLDSITVYKELAPFAAKIQKQHEDIMKNARMRQDFTANVSHELKTPLTSISGYSELIETGMATDQDVERFAREIHKNSERLLTLINDIIRLSELDVTDQEVAVSQVDLYTVADNCVNMLQVNAENHQVSIELVGTRCIVLANREMMEELVYNLCDNAIRYNNPGGSVRVWVTQNEQESVLKVKDTGIGISKEHQERIFERFYRVDKSRSKSTGGTGLGLAIVKHIVAQSNAKMELKSELGQGTEIRVVFPNQV